MPKEAPLPAENPGYNGIARDPHTSLAGLAERYLLTQVASQAESTQDAKRRDLTCFLHFYTQRYGHDNARAWYMSVTEAFVKELAGGQVPRPQRGASQHPSASPGRRSPARMRPWGTSPAGSTSTVSRSPPGARPTA
ncbi:MAG TPA: hypothetical protein VHN13_16730 [Candidatus Tectomicrobia bacterium]|nr:hypothetical protein [Candidatus Tectomicrobia bacterium]